MVAASIWLGGLVMLGAATVVALRTLERDDFRRFIRAAGRTFAVLAAGAWLLLGLSGLALAHEHGWTRPLVLKTGLAVLVVAMTVAHTLLGARTGSRAAVMSSRALSVLILVATLLIFWIALNLG